MANEADVILKTLMRVGLDVKGEDLKNLEAKLKKLGDAVDLKPAKAQAKELSKLFTELKRDRALLERAATQGPAGLNKRDRADLPDAFNRLKTFQGGLNKLVGTLKNFGFNERQPLFREMAKLEALSANFGATLSKVSPQIDGVTKAFKANTEAAKKAQTEATKLQRTQEAQARTADALERSRRTRAIQTPEGRRAFLTAARGNTEEIGTAASAKQGRAFAASAVRASERAVQLERDRPTPDLKAIERAERKLARSAQAFNALDQRAGQLTAIEALDKKTRQLDRDSRIEGQKDPAAKKAAYSALRGDLTAITTSADASKGAAFALKELNARKQIQHLTEQVFGAESKEATRTARQLEALSQAYAGLTQRVKDLAEVEKLSTKNKRKAEQLALTEAGVAQRRNTRGQLQRPGRTALEQAGGIGAGVDGFGNVDAAKKAQAFVKGELGDLIKLQNAYSRTFGVTSDQAKIAAVEVERYGEYLRKLEGRIQSLGATADTQQQIDKHKEAVRTSEERRRNSALKQATGKQLLEEANGDFSAYTDRQALRRAKNFANAELTQLRAQQESAARTVGASSGEFDRARKDGDEFAKTVALIDQRLDHLATTVRTMPKLNTFGSSQAHPEGKRLYDNAQLQDGGVSNLSGDDAKKAYQYLKARQAEQVTFGRQLEKLGGANRDALNAAGDATRKFAADLDVLNKALVPPSEGLNIFQSTLRSFLKYAVGYSALYGLAAAVVALGRSLVDLQTELLEIQAVTGSTDGQMGKLTDTIMNVARTSKFSLLDLTKATKVLAQAGISVEGLNTSLQATADFAAATGANLEVAADLLSTTRSVFKEMSDDTISNQLAKAINISKLTAEDLKTILSLGAQTAKSFNLTSEQFLAAVAVLRNAGLKQSTAATGLRQGMLEIFSPDAKLIKALQARYRDLGEDMGAEAVRARFFAFSRGRTPLIAALSELKRLGFNDEGSLGLSRAFDIRSANAIKALIANMEELSASEGKITFGRAAAAGAATTIEGLNASFTRLLSTITGFTYSRSEGLLGWLTNVIQDLGTAIEKLDEWDLKRRSRGEVSLSGPNGIGVLDILGPNRITPKFVKSLFGKPEETPAVTADRADTSAKTLADSRAQFEKFEAPARNADIRLAKLGETVGSTGESLVKIEQVSHDLDLTIARVFGPGMEAQREQLVKLAQSYSNLTPSERDVRIDELIAKFPQLKKLDKDQRDRMLASLAGMGTAVEGFLKGRADSLQDELVKSHETLRELRLNKRQATTPAEMEAVVNEEIARRYPELLDIMRGDSKLSANQQITIFQMASQAWAELMRSKGGGGAFLKEEAKKQAEALILRIKEISLTGNKGTAEIDVRVAIQSLAKENEKLGKAAVSRMEQIKGFLTAAADQLEPGANKSLLETGVKEATKEQEITGAKSVAEIDARVKLNNELFEPVRKNPDFRTNLEQMPDTTVGRAAALSYTEPGSEGIPIADVLNGTQAFKDFLALASTFNDVYNKQYKVRKAYLKELKEGQALGDAVENNTTAFNDAKVNKQFPEARRALDAKINAQIAVEQENLAETERQRVANLPNDDVDKTKTILKNELDAKARIAKLEIERAKELEQLNREEAKVNLKRTEGELRLKQGRLRSVLANATSDTPQAVIDDAVKQLDQTNVELGEAFEERKRLEGAFNDQAESEIEERKKALRPYLETAEALQHSYNREREAREKLLSQLDVTLSTGSNLRDARLEDAGLIPGDRNLRAQDLLRRHNVLSQQIGANESSLPQVRSDIAQLEQSSRRDPGDNEVAERLRLARERERELIRDTAELNHELGITDLNLERVTGTWESGMKRALDPDVIMRSLEQSESSFEHFGEVINEQVIGAIEGVGDAFADAVVEGESLSDSIDKVFSQLGKETLRTLIKTLSNETISSLTGSLFGNTGQDGQGGFVPALLAKFGIGNKPAQSAPTSTATEPAQPGSFMEQVGTTLFGGTETNDAAATDACCLPKETGDAMKKVAEGPGLAELANTEGKGFFDSLGSGFVNLLDNVTNGFGQVFGNLGGLLGLASSNGPGQATGLFSLGTALAGVFAGGAGGGAATYKGAFGFAGGGIIHGPGSGTSDSIPAYVKGVGGRIKPLALSNGESILTAKATATLGEGFVHAVNSGRMLRASTGAVIHDQASLSNSSTAATSSQSAGGGGGGSTTYQVHVTPAQMRMRMGDWLDQQILNERATR